MGYSLTMLYFMVVFLFGRRGTAVSETITIDRSINRSTGGQTYQKRKLRAIDGSSGSADPAFLLLPFSSSSFFFRWLLRLSYHFFFF